MNKVKPVFRTEIFRIRLRTGQRVKTASSRLSSGQMIRIFSVVTPHNGKIH